MIEYKTITVQVYRSPDGAPTCAANFDTGHVCPFLVSEHYGTRDACSLTSGALHRSNDGRGWLIPAAGCLLHREVQA